MKRSYLIPILVLLLVSLACSVSLPFGIGGGSNLPTAEAGPPDKSTPTVGIPETKNVYREDFDLSLDNWSDDIVVTTQAQPGTLYSEVSLDDGWLRFHLKDNETYMYKFYRDPMQRDVVIETKLLNLGDVHNGMAIICRGAVDYSSWYEFRLSGTNDYALYYYDQQRKEQEGLNPYQELERGVSKEILPMLENIVIVSCIDTSLRLEINGVEVFVEDSDLLMDDGLVGFGAISYDIQPVIVKYDYIDVSRPK